jgi:hypothetical protein
MRERLAARENPFAARDNLVWNLGASQMIHRVRITWRPRIV